jgi:hypothetical protein
MAETPSHPDLRAILAGCKMLSQDEKKRILIPRKRKKI